MKTIHCFLLALTTTILGATESAKPACCAADGAAASVAVPLTARSLYQLDAKFTDDTGQTVQLTTFRGQPVIAAMFFAQCEYACPMLVSDIQRVRAALAPDVRARTRVVLVSFDTARDTPAVLKAYRERIGLDAGVTLLRGNASSVQELAMLLGVKFKQDDRGQFAHSNLITVLNAEGEIVHQRAGLQGDISEVARAVTTVRPEAKR
jgi:protein SCO1/2